MQRPSVEVLVPRLVAHDDLPGAAALAGLLGTAAQTGGPLIAGGLLVAGLPLAYAVGGATCAVAAVPFARMRPNAPAPDADRPSLRGLAEGLRYAKSRPDLLGTYLIDIGAMFFGAPYAVFPQIAAGLGGPAVLGLLYAAPGIGSMAVSLTSTWTRHVYRHGRAIALAVCGWGVAITAFAFAPSLPLAVLALAAAGGSDMVSGLFRMTMWNQTIPARVRGRLAGLEMISYYHRRAAWQPGVRRGRHADRLGPAGRRLWRHHERARRRHRLARAASPLALRRAGHQAGRAGDGRSARDRRRGAGLPW